jgi:hypothetical protein
MNIKDYIGDETGWTIVTKKEKSRPAADIPPGSTVDLIIVDTWEEHDPFRTLTGEVVYSVQTDVDDDYAVTYVEMLIDGDGELGFNAMNVAAYRVTKKALGSPTETFDILEAAIKSAANNSTTPPDWGAIAEIVSCLRDSYQHAAGVALAADAWNSSSLYC